MGCIKSKNISQEQLDFLITNTCYDEKTIRVWHASFMQDCPDGEMTQEKFVKKHAKFFPGDFCQKFFKTFDTFGKGYLTFRDYLLAINMTYARIPEDKLKVAFKYFRLDCDGELSYDEMTNIVKDIFKTQKVSTTTINAVKKSTNIIFSQMEINEYTGYLTEEEFVNGCLHDDLLLHNMMLHCHYLDDGGNPHFRRMWSRASLKKIISEKNTRLKNEKNKRKSLKPTKKDDERE